MGYSERAEYTSRETLKEKLRTILQRKSTALRTANKLSYEIINDSFPFDRATLESRIIALLNIVFKNKRTTRSSIRRLFDNNDVLAGLVLGGLRSYGVLQPEGARRHAKWVFAPGWVYHDHEVSGE